MSTAIDLAPLYGSMIGVDRMADLIETALRGDASAPCPPFDVEMTGEGAYRISLAAAGFSPADLQVVTQANLLVISGRKATGHGQQARTYLHQGLAQRPFELRFQLTDHVIVSGASHAHGMLVIDLARQVPEGLEPRQIPIKPGPDRSAPLRQAASSQKAA
ncbi:Hsp20 family protein [Caulobacter endophyticus]|uniref:Hsp20 family protein n=1 Tax=Caulobacter endophyticus TaxID=2172652 RepID=UPI0024105D3C|nr:Hsp20 family protein [Caulobacter endophyticus]MDG2528117.1 Hsp20 family protein [Caulobacter endophyticus]